MPTGPFIAINLALLFYSIGVWSERIQGRLKPWHLAFFYGGLVCDTIGTGMMSSIVSPADASAACNNRSDVAPCS